jgi:hypothetical protein
MRQIGNVGGWRRALGAVTAALVLSIASPSPARAGSYDVYGCRMPSGSPIASFGGWSDELTGKPTNVSCADATPIFGNVGWVTWPRASRQRLGEGVGIRFMAPAGTRIGAAELFRWFERRSAPGEGYARYVLRADGRELESCHTASCVSLGSAFLPAVSPEQRIAFEDLDAQRITARIECPTIEGCSDDDVSGRPVLMVMASHINLVDNSAPRFVAPPSGGLLATGTPLTGEHAVRYRVSDVGGGLARIGLILDGVVQAEQTVDPAARACRLPFTESVPCPLERSGEIVFDTGNLANGTHSIQVWVADAAGNAARSDPHTIVTRNRSRPNGSGASSYARTRLWLPVNGRKPMSRRVPFGTRAELAGMLMDEASRPIRGATLDLATREAHSRADWRSLSPIVTDRRGRFRATLPAGPSRKVRVSYRAYSADPAYSASAEADLTVRAAVRFSASPRHVRNGSVITFRGRLRGGPGRRGVTVVIYAVGRRVRGQRARVPVEALRTDRHGRFAYRYRFQKIAGPFHYRFQARVRPDRGYPYAPGRSKIVHVAARP